MPNDQGLLGSQQPTGGHYPTVGADMLIHFHVITFHFMLSITMWKNPPFIPIHNPSAPHISLIVPYYFLEEIICFQHLVIFMISSMWIFLPMQEIPSHRDFLWVFSPCSHLSFRMSSTLILFSTFPHVEKLIHTFSSALPHPPFFSCIFKSPLCSNT
jgi:hypothetical protein